MKVYLMHPDRDFDITAELRDATLDAMRSGNPFALEKAASPSTRQTREPTTPPTVLDLLTEDLGLESLFQAMADGDSFLLETARRALLSGLSDPDAIAHRQEIVADALACPDVVRRLYDLSVRAIEHERNPGTIFRPTRDPESLLTWSVKVLELELEVLAELRAIADAAAPTFRSVGFRRFFDMVATELDDDYLALLREHLDELRFDGGLLASACLGRGGKSTHWIMHRTPPSHWRERFGFGPGTPTHSFDISPGDAPGQRALASLRSRALTDVADAAAQAVADVKDFFTTLRLELAFHVGCLNLRERLTARSQPICWPEATSGVGRDLVAHDLRDAGLALTSDSPLVGNDLDAGHAALVVITGANQGGKTTLLRAIGTAQVMMRAGMFVCAQTFRASVASRVLTHWTRGEDTAMLSGKLDEELQRMSQVADNVTPHCLLLCNESFASTNEREGSEIGRHVLEAMLDSSVTVMLVTHMFELAERLRIDTTHEALFLRAAPGIANEPSFRISPGYPLHDSVGIESSARIISAEPSADTKRRPA